VRKNFLPKVKSDAHKYSRGVVAVCAGSEKYPGAAILATGGARRGGVGYVQFLSSSTRLQDLVVSSFPDVVPISNVRDLKADALLLGSGEAKIKNFTTEIPRDIPLVLDGGSIALAKKFRNEITVVTPHEGEVHYLGTPRKTREETSVSLAKQYKCIVVLKGRQTVVATPTGMIHIDRVGGPELSTAGSGDILAGLIASMLASWKAVDERSAFEAVVKAVAFHSEAGRYARKRKNPVVATDILEALPHIN
jgi:hydroxyethylthiazole kinase-like uncharacterized protein yjeF